MKRRIVTEDVVFKKIFGGGTKASKRILKHILETFLDIKVHKIEVLNPTLTTGRDEKQMIADILLCVNGKDFVIIEMQNYYQRDNNARFVSYESVLTMLRCNRGQAYDYGRNIILVFLGYSNRKDGVVNEDVICHRYDDGYMYSDKYSIQIVELHNVRKLIDKPVELMTRQERYKFFIALVGCEEVNDKIDEIVKEEAGLKMTLAEIYKTVEEKDLPTALMNWAAEYNLMQDQLYEEARQRELAQAKAKIKKANKRVAEAEGKIVKAEEKIVKAKENIAKAEEKAGKAEEETMKERERREKAEEEAINAKREIERLQAFIRKINEGDL